MAMGGKMNGGVGRMRRGRRMRKWWRGQRQGFGLMMYNEKGGGEKERNKSIWSGELWEGSRVGGDKS